eukprot:gene11042-3748_t
MKITSQEKKPTAPEEEEDLLEVSQKNQENIINIKNTFEFNQIPFNEEKDLYFVTNITAPKFQHDDSHKRSPIDLICVIDKSGSMYGTKIELVKTSLLFVVQQLKSDDRLGIITFDAKVNVDFSLSEMDKQGKENAIKAIEKIKSGSTTNLSGGLFEALDILESRKESSDVSSILLFTDGLANKGMIESKEIVEGMENYLKKFIKPVSIFTFGFGEEHDPNMLRDISGCSNGLYYYVKSEDEIPGSFADALGGLLSVVAQNIKISIKTRGTTKILESLSSYKTKLGLDGKHCEIVLDDLYSEEQRDLVFIVRIPKLEAESGNHFIFEVEIAYFNVIEKKKHKLQIDGIIKRPEKLESPNEINIELDKQRNRVEVTIAMDKAKKAADENKLSEARRILHTMINSIKKSASYEDKLSKGLEADLKYLLESLVDSSSYSSFGQKNINDFMMQTRTQRSNNSENFCSPNNNGIQFEKMEMREKSKKYFASKVKTNSFY